MPMIEFTVEELENIQDLLLMVKAMGLMLRIPERWDLPVIESKVNNVIGDKIKMFKRRKIEDGIRECFKNDPHRMAVVMKKFNRDYPLPEGLRH